MSKIAIVTDSNSGITQAKGKEMGIYVLPMPFYINGELFLEDITLTQEEYEKPETELAKIPVYGNRTDADIAKLRSM